MKALFAWVQTFVGWLLARAVARPVFVYRLTTVHRATTRDEALKAPLLPPDEGAWECVSVSVDATFGLVYCLWRKPVAT